MSEFITKTGLHIVIDEADLDLVGNYAWRLNPKGYLIRRGWRRQVLDEKGDVIIPGKKIEIALHKQIAERYGLRVPGSGKVVDHINRNKLDVRRDNLRPATLAQNAWNKSINRRNKTGVSGVCYVKTKGAQKWRASVGHWGNGGKVKMFYTVEEAAIWREAEFKKALSAAGL